MKKLLAALVSTAVFALPVTVSLAAEAPSSGPYSSAFAQVTSNYVFRGQTQTEDGAAIQGGYDIKQAEDKGWYAGVWGSNVNQGIEVDLYGGWKGIFGDQNRMGYDVGAILYKYTDSANTDITEIYGGMSYETAYAKLFLGNGPGISSYTYLDIGASFVVMQDVDLDLHYGRISSNGGSNDVSAGLSMDIKGYDLGLGLTYEDEGPKNEFEFFVTVKKEFAL